MIVWIYKSIGDFLLVSVTIIHIFIEQEIEFGRHDMPKAT